MFLTNRELASASKPKFILGDAGLVDDPFICTQHRPSAVCQQDWGPLTIALRIVPRPAPGLYFKALGYASKPYITVNFSRVEEVATQSGVASDRILGCVIAHELGHALLGPNAHSESDIIMGVWNSEVLRQVGEMFIGFQPQEEKLLRQRFFSNIGKPLAWRRTRWYWQRLRRTTSMEPAPRTSTS
jgi:hypothetical protein